VAGARDVPLPRPRVLAVGAALQQKLPGALAVDPHVHRPVVVAVPWLGDAGLHPGGVEDIEALFRCSSHLGGGAGGD